MDIRTIAKEIYKIFKETNTLENPELSTEDTIAVYEDYLSDLEGTKAFIQDLTEIDTSLNYFLQTIKPVLEILECHQIELEAQRNKRMVSNSSYEVKHAIHIGDKEIVYAEDMKAADGNCYFVGNYTRDFPLAQYADCLVSGDYLEIMQEFTNRVSTQINAVRMEHDRHALPTDIFTSDHYLPNDYSQNLTGKIVAIKAEVLRPEYRCGDVQLVLVNGGSGAEAHPRGNAVYCYHLNNGKHTRFERYDVQGEVKPEFLPEWVKERAAAILAEKNAVQPNKKEKDKGDSR